MKINRTICVRGPKDLAPMRVEGNNPIDLEAVSTEKVSKTADKPTPGPHPLPPDEVFAQVKAAGVAGQALDHSALNPGFLGELRGPEPRPTRMPADILAQFAAGPLQEAGGLAASIGAEVALNPQPLPPGKGVSLGAAMQDAVDLNPQPLPPGRDRGIVGQPHHGPGPDPGLDNDFPERLHRSPPDVIR